VFLLVVTTDERTRIDNHKKNCRLTADRAKCYKSGVLWKRVPVRLLAASAAFFAGVLPLPAQPPTSGEIRAIAERAYTFAYPIVLMEYTRRAAVERGTLGGVAAMNHFMNAPAFPDDHFRQVIRPNADTLYSSAWLDLSQEPQVLRLQDTHGRYYLMQFMDAWTETFDVPGKRTTGTGDGWFVVVGPGWKGKLPERAKRIDAPTNMVWLLGRTQTNGASDYENVHAIQRGYVLMPLSQYPDGPKPVRPGPPAGTPAKLTPPMQVERLTAVEFFTTFASLLEANPAHKEDAAMMRELARIGIVPGKPFQADALGPGGMKALEEAASAVSKWLALTANGAIGTVGKTGWSGFGTKVGRYGTDYKVRAEVARMGLGANPPEDATYMQCQQDADGQPFHGSHKYRLHFAKGQTPPVRAFWSVTMYSEDGYFVANPINRFAIGDRDPLKFNADGSLDLIIQHDAPEGDKQANWLPAPAGSFNLNLRMYWPKENVLSGQWIPPAVSRESN